MPAARPFYIQEDDSPAKREILRAALTLFSERGLAATSIRDIADESGYTNPALYRHFAGKDELALYLFEICHARVYGICADALASRDGFAEKLDAYVAAWLGGKGAQAIKPSDARVFITRTWDDVDRELARLRSQPAPSSSAAE